MIQIESIELNLDHSVKSIGWSYLNIKTYSGHYDVEDVIGSDVDLSSYLLNNIDVSLLHPSDEEIKELRKQAYSIEVDYLISQYNRHLIMDTGIDLTQLINEIENKTNNIKERYPYSIDNPMFKIKT